MKNLQAVITYENTDRVLSIPVGSIKPNPYQPRKFFDVTSVSELAKSIQEYGVLQPITVRRLRAGTYELIAGERRLRAAEIAGLSVIPAILMNVTDDDSAVLALIENIQRRDLTFFEEAEAYYNLMRDHDLTQEQIAKKTGKKQSTIANKLRIRKLSPTVKNIIEENGLTERHARLLLKVPEETMRLDMLKKILEKNLSVAAAESLVDEEIKKLITKRPPSVSVPKSAGVTDYRIFLNTIKKALDMVKDAGVQAKTRQKEYDGYYEYVIRIKK